MDLRVYDRNQPTSNVSAKPNSYTTTVNCTPTTETRCPGVSFPRGSVTFAGIVSFHDKVVTRTINDKTFFAPNDNNGSICAAPFTVSGMNQILEHLTKGKVMSSMESLIAHEMFDIDKPSPRVSDVLKMFHSKDFYSPTDFAEAFVNDDGTTRDPNEYYSKYGNNVKTSMRGYFDKYRTHDTTLSDLFDIRRIVNEIDLIGPALSANSQFSGDVPNNGVDFCTSGDVFVKDYWSPLLQKHHKKNDSSYVNLVKSKKRKHGDVEKGDSDESDEEEYIDYNDYSQSIGYGEHVGFSLRLITEEDMQHSDGHRESVVLKKEHFLPRFQLIPAIRERNGNLTYKHGQHFFELGKCVEPKLCSTQNNQTLHDNEDIEVGTDEFIKINISLGHNS